MLPFWPSASAFYMRSFAITARAPHCRAPHRHSLIVCYIMLTLCLHYAGYIILHYACYIILHYAWVI